METQGKPVRTGGCINTETQSEVRTDNVKIMVGL